MSRFNFKQFCVSHESSTMKVGTDAVLIGAWTELNTIRHALDLGTGCGIIALIIAQRCNASILAIDLDEDSIVEANRNFSSSPWKDRLIAQKCDFRDFDEYAERFDLIVSNPPYFRNSLKSDTIKRTLARHDDSLNLHHLFQGSYRLLKKEGLLSFIIPFQYKSDCLYTATTYGFYPARICDVAYQKGKAVSLCMIEFKKTPWETRFEKLFLRATDGEYTEDYKKLTGEFYLEF